MSAGKLLYRMIVAAVAVVFFHLGFTTASGSPAAARDVMFTSVDGATRMTVLTDEEPRLGVSISEDRRTLTLRFESAVLGGGLKELEHSDDLIESVSATEDASGAALVIRFKEPDVTFYRSEVPAGHGVVFDFRPTKRKLALSGVTPSMIIGKRRDGDQAAPAAAPKETSKEEIEARFADIDGPYSMMEARSGREAFIEIMKQLQKQMFDEAARLSSRFIETYPDSIYLENVYFARADAFYQKAKRDPAYVQAAMSAYNTAAARFPDSPLVQQAMMRRADLYAMDEFYIEALSEYGGLLSAYPAGKYAVAAMLGRAEIYLKRKKYQQAYNELEKILILYPARREVRDAKYMVAESYYERGMYKEADIIFHEAMEFWPTYPKERPETFMKIADTSYRLGKTAEAVRDWSVIVNLFPEAPQGREALLRIGEAYVLMGRKREGAEIFEAAARRFADVDEGIKARLALASLGAEDPEILKRSGVFDYSAFQRPLETFDEIIAKYPEKHGREALLRKGKALSARKRYVSAILAYKQLLGDYPSAKMSEEVFNLVRENLLRLIETFHDQDGFFTVLMTYYENFDPFLRGIKDPGILYRIAESYEVMTLYGRAGEYYRLVKAAGAEGRYGEAASFNMARAALREGEDPALAERLLRTFLRDYRGSERANSARILLGDALFAQGKKAQAATEWRLALEAAPAGPAVPEVAYRLGEVYKSMGRNSLAIDSYNRAIAAYRPLSRTRPEPSYIKDSYYKLAEAHYLRRDFPSAIREAARFVDRYPDDGRRGWMDYIISASLEKIDREDMALPRLKKLAEREKETMIGKVAKARLDTLEWKNKNQDLFLD